MSQIFMLSIILHFQKDISMYVFILFLNLLQIQKSNWH